MDATTTIEVQLSDPAHNFFIDRSYTYGEITICFLLILIVGLRFWELLLKVVKKDV